MDAPRTNRRDFLQGKAAAEALADAATRALDAVTPDSQSHGVGGDSAAASAWSESDRSDASYLLRVARRAMACEFEVLLNANQYPEGTEAAIEALNLVDQLEDQLTVYRESSEVSYLNAHAAAGPVDLEAGLYALVRQAAALSAETGGAYDITSGPLSKVWGFYRRAGQLPAVDDLQAALAKVGSQHLEFDDARREVRFLRPGVEINLGSIGKGYALDRCRELLLEAGVNDFLLHGGQSSVLAQGSRGANRSARNGWIVGLKHPLLPERRLAEFRLRDRALGTSGSGTQFFLHRGRRYGHILDPRTGQPAEGVLSATVIAPTAAAADSLSTAFYVLGIEGTARYCEQRPEVGAVLVVPKSGTHVELIAHNLSGDDYRVLSH